MRYTFLLLIAPFFLALPISAQQGFDPGKTIPIKEVRSASVNLGSIQEDYFPQLQTLEMPKPGADPYNDYLETIKEKIKPSKEAYNPEYKTMENSPALIKGFAGNAWANSAPNDNDMAVSNSGKIVSVINSTINVYDAGGNLLKTSSLDAFSAGLKLAQGKYDPRVLYDPDADRFVFACLNGFNDSTSYIVLGFSKTNDPLGEWNMYALSGEPLGDTTWSDYPIIALNKDELILTINALQNNKTWQLGFRQSFIWQIDKNTGYQGQSLKTLVHSGIKYNGAPLRNICPVQGGSGLTGSGTVYLLSNKNFSVKSDSIFLLKLSGKLDDPNNKLELSLLKSSGKYGVPPQAKQPYKKTFETNDARILDAFIENNKIQFVGNSSTLAGKAGVFHGILSDPSGSPSATINIISDPKLDFGYPGIAYSGTAAGDDNAIILLNHSSDSIKPGTSVVFYKNGNYSPVNKTKDGENIINVIGSYERWGDYSGAQVQYNKPGLVWLAGTYGVTKTMGGGTKLPVYGTWIAALADPYSGITGIEEKPDPMASEVTAFPSPVIASHPVNVSFNLKRDAYLYFRVYDMSGRLLVNLLSDQAGEGRNTFSFDSSPLPAGTYILSIEDKDSHRLSGTRFVVQ